MKAIFLKFILLTSISIVLCSAAQAQQVVSAKGKTFILTKARIEFLKRFDNPFINKAIENCVTIKYNSTADIIVDILSLPYAPKVKQQLLTSK